MKLAGLRIARADGGKFHDFRGREGIGVEESVVAQLVSDVVADFG
jgi:hypothetical protein